MKHIVQTEDAATSTDDSDFDHALQIPQSNIRKNTHGQVKTSRNVKRPKPPLPPLKRTLKAPLHRSERNIAKQKPEVCTNEKYNIKIWYKLNNTICFLQL